MRNAALPLSLVLGNDGFGVVTEVGQAVQWFAPGDAVYMRIRDACLVSVTTGPDHRLSIPGRTQRPR